MRYHKLQNEFLLFFCLLLLAHRNKTDRDELFEWGMSEEGDLVDLYRVGVDEAVECSENLLCGNDFECFDDFLDFLESTGGTGRCRAT